MITVMNETDFLAFREQLTTDRHQIADDKAKTYANTDNRLINFVRNAKRYGMRPEQTLGIYLGKHMDSIETYISSGVQNKEGVMQNIIDAENYLDLLGAMVFVYESTN